MTPAAERLARILGQLAHTSIWAVNSGGFWWILADQYGHGINVHAHVRADTLRQLQTHGVIKTGDAVPMPAYPSLHEQWAHPVTVLPARMEAFRV